MQKNNLEGICTNVWKAGYPSIFSDTGVAQISTYDLNLSLPCFSSVQFSHSVVSDYLRPHELQHSRPPYPSPTPRVHSNSRPLSRWSHPAISSCHPLLLLPPIPPSIRVFSNELTLCMRWPKYWSISFSIIPSKEHPGPKVLGKIKFL